MFIYSLIPYVKQRLGRKHIGCLLVDQQAVKVPRYAVIRIPQRVIVPVLSYAIEDVILILIIPFSYLGFPYETPMPNRTALYQLLYYIN